MSNRLVRWSSRTWSSRRHHSSSLRRRSVFHSWCCLSASASKRFRSSCFLITSCNNCSPSRIIAWRSCASFPSSKRARACSSFSTLRRTSLSCLSILVVRSCTRIYQGLTVSPCLTYTALTCSFWLNRKLCCLASLVVPITVIASIISLLTTLYRHNQDINASLRRRLRQSSILRPIPPSSDWQHSEHTENKQSSPWPETIPDYNQRYTKTHDIRNTPKRNKTINSKLLLKSQRINWSEFRCFPGRHTPKHNTHSDCTTTRHHNNIRSQENRNIKATQQSDNSITRTQSNHSPYQQDHHQLNQKLTDNMPPLCSNRFTYSDFTCSLCDWYKHHIHYPHSSNQ